MTVRLVLVVDIAGWEVELISEPMSESVADLLLLELSRNPTFAIKKAMKSRD